MKLFIHTTHRYYLLFICTLTNVVSARNTHANVLLPAYKNRISHISYAVGTDDHHAITLKCDYNPICIYTPLAYQSTQDDRVQKTYFLPRTQCAEHHTRYFYDDLIQFLEPIGIDLQIEEMKDYNYGLRMTFTMPSSQQYDITKIVDFNNKLVHFAILPKI